MNYNEALNYISSFKTVSLKPSLKRISRLLNLMDNPHRYLKVIHVAGTNGKGSVVGMISSVLTSLGFKTGMYISPYITDFCERIQINGQMIARNDLARICTKIKEIIDSQPNALELSQFELTTAVCFQYFRNCGCDYCVLETGLGGKYDATNVVERPLCTVLTRVSLDHTHVLGDTVEKIAEEKSGIIKPEVPLITCPQEESVIKLLKEVCRKNASQFILTDMTRAEDVEISLAETSFSYNGEKFTLPLLGAHQIENALMAITALRAVIPKVTSMEICMGFSALSHPGRLELISNSPQILIDGAHNEDAARVLCKFLKSVNWKGSILFSAMRDKNYSKVLKVLSSVSDSVSVVTVQNNPRAEGLDSLEKTAGKYFSNVQKLESYTDALSQMTDGNWLVCGSLFLVSDIRKLLKTT